MLKTVRSNLHIIIIIHTYTMNSLHLINIGTSIPHNEAHIVNTLHYTYCIQSM